MQLYRIDNVTGEATLITYNGSANIFNNTLGNGYKSGSITFMLRKDGTYKLIYTTESQVYASLGLVFWIYDIVGNTIVTIGQNRTHSTATSGIPGAGTGKINTAYGDGKFYFARDNGNLYWINMYAPSNSTTAVTQETTTPLVNANDFGYWKNE
jgi:outer membrane lipoprotein-sorting protein